MSDDSLRLTFLHPDTDDHTAVPLAGAGVKAGFPSPADDFIEQSIDLNRLLIRNPPATFLVRVDGDSMQDECILDGSLVVVDKSLRPADGDVAVCWLDGEFTLKRIRIERERVVLMPANKRFEPIVVGEDDPFTVWGVVRSTIRILR